MNAVAEIMEFSKRAQGRKELIRHLEGGTLYRSEAIKAKCFDCMGNYFDGVISCQIPACPLFPYNPYKGRSGNCVEEGDEVEVLERSGRTVDVCTEIVYDKECS